MKKFSLFASLLVLIFLSSSALAHDQDMPYDVGSWDEFSVIHTEPIEGPFKGYAFVEVTNVMGVPWYDFHFELGTAGVIFREPTAEEGTDLIAMLDGDKYGTEHSGYTCDISQDEMKLDFEFYGNPVLADETVTFRIYTDNLESNPWFSLCMYPTPEPATIALLGLGSIILLRRRKK